ncbi:hypothetical protein CHS0354_027403 [Potamilus streckersoni]|uniref:Acetolactate synthase n=1 Tax=Potamilus streckersoni TaxID=2493646 RepID=A0AAE0SQL1_9BIVA|nr:hypothetical protein CHS0354_027403 [Potamilus streckersoni]
MISGASAIVKTLELLGVKVIFGYPGGANLPLYDALIESNIQHILTRHEQGAALMANGYGRITGVPGVCLVTSGPGATNAVTGIADAYQDSVPMLTLSGQIPNKFIGTDAFQEVDCINMTLPITKHNELVTKAEDLVPALRSAFYIGGSGRKGPVLLDIPRDVMEEKRFYDLYEERDLPGYQPTTAGDIGQIRRILKLLAKAERPVIIAGGGIHLAGAIKEFTDFIRLTNIPVVRTLMGKGILSDDDRLFAGMMGTHGNTDGNKAAAQADVIFAIGARFGDRSTLQKKNEFGKGAKIIHLDIDPAEIGKIVRPDIPIVGDIKVVLQQLLDNDEKYPVRFAEPWFKSKSASNVLYKEDAANILELICRELSKIDEKLIITTDVGRHQMWATHACTNPKHMPILTSGGLGTMGFGLPGAIGAWFAERRYPVINITGDGSFWMNMQELTVAVEHKIPLTVLICNDYRLGMIRELQHTRHSKRYFANDFQKSVDYVKLAESVGAAGRRVEYAQDILPAITASVESGLPTVIDFDIFRIDENSRAGIKKSA